MMSQSEVGYLKGQIHSSNYSRGFKVYLSGLDPMWSEQDIYRFMNRFGNILNINIARNEKQVPRGYGFVFFSTAVEASSSVGIIQYQDRTVEVKPSHKNNYQGYNGQKPHLDYQDTQSKHTTRTLERTADGVSPICRSPKAGTKKSPALSKYSKNFETLASLNSMKSRDLDAVSVKIIKLSQDATPEEKFKTASELSPIQSPNHSVKPVEKSTHISKFSKEFHPKSLQQTSAQSVDMGPQVSSQAAFMSLFQHEDGNFYKRMAGQIQADFGDITAIRTKSADSERLLFAESTVRIKFYTFPGRE